MMFWPLKLALKIISAIISVAILYVGFTGYQVWKTSTEYKPIQADAILVMGTAAYPSGPSPELKARLQAALDLYQQFPATKYVVVTGGKQPGDLATEAVVSRDWLVSRGVKAQFILSGGVDSYENVAFAATAMRAAGIKHVLCVTDPFHEHRSMAIFSTFGFSPSPTPTQISPIKGSKTIPFFIRETLAVSAGRLIGYGNLSSITHATA
jgi:uncharacterized SAM-binding protein YcdF (DUF218 family)